jgi:hypothetical protein
MTVTIIESDPRKHSLVSTIYDSPDYLDRFVAEVEPNRFATVDEVATAWFIEQPAWIRLISTNTFSTRRISNAVSSGRFQSGTSVGSWQVIDRNDNEIVFGDDMGFMQYRFAFHLNETADAIEAATAVRYLWPRAGRFYFMLAKPVHRRFIRYLLARTANASGATK